MGGIQEWWAKLATWAKAAAIGVPALLLLIFVVTMASGGSHDGLPTTDSYRSGYKFGSSVISMATVGPPPTDGEMRNMCGQDADTVMGFGDRDFQLAPGQVNRGDFVDGCVAGMAGMRR